MAESGLGVTLPGPRFLTRNRSFEYMTAMGRVTVPDRLAVRAAERPDDVALAVLGGGSLTFRDWQARASQAARGLAARGVGRGDRVVVPCATDDWPGYAVAYVAVQMVGATVVPVLRTLGPEHLRRVCAASGAVAVLGDADEARIRVWCVTTDVLAQEGHSTAPFDSPVTADDDAEVLYTSGTTGVPKGVVASHANVLFTHSTHPRRDGVKVVLHAVPPGSLAGQGLLLQPLDATRHRVVTMPRFEPRAFLSAVPQFGVTDVVLVPALALMLLQHQDSGVDLSSVEVVRTMSAPIPPVALERLASMFDCAAIMNLYTTTEAWPARTRIRFDPARLGSVGRSEGTGAVRITGETGEPAPAGVEGNVELRLSGAPVRRYLDEPRGAVFLPGGWVRTGDIGRLDEDGYLYLVDRNADLVISGGLNVSTIEVEAALQEFPGVTESAVFGLPHRVLGEYVVAAVHPGDGYERAALNEFLAARLGPAKAPKRIVEVTDFPRNAMGKVIKRALRERYANLSEVVDTVDTGEPPDEHAGTLRGYWADALGTDTVPWTVSFVELGGTSLSAMEVVGRVGATLRRRVSQRDMFEVADLREFVTRVASAPEVEPAADVLGPIRRVRRG